MRYFPVGQRIPKAVAWTELEVHPSSKRLSLRPLTLITGPNNWGYCAFLPIKPPGPGHLFIKVSLAVQIGRVGVALQRRDETIVEQFGLPDRWGSSTVSFFVDTPEDCHHLLFRNWGDANGCSKFTIEEVEVRPAYREMTLEQFKCTTPEDWVMLERPWLQYLELHLLDFCSLSCPFCSHGTPGRSRGDAYISLNQLRQYSRLLESHEFDAIKVVGGEPSIHPEFRQICGQLRQLFITMRADLASNGARLEQFLDCIDCFDCVDVSHYPGRNDASFELLSKINKPNISTFVKRDRMELFDSRLEPHRNQVFVYENCSASCSKMISPLGFFDCPGVYAQLSEPKNFSSADSSVPMNAEWRRNMAALDIRHYCKRCFYPADAPCIVDAEYVSEPWKVCKQIGRRYYNCKGEVVRASDPWSQPLTTRDYLSSLWIPPMDQPYEINYFRLHLSKVKK